MLELFGRYEKVILSVYLTRPRRSCRHGNRQSVAFMSADQFLHQGAFAGSGKA
jgi:hypothetical protein